MIAWRMASSLGKIPTHSTAGLPASPERARQRYLFPGSAGRVSCLGSVPEDFPWHQCSLLTERRSTATHPKKALIKRAWLALYMRRVVIDVATFRPDSQWHDRSGCGMPLGALRKAKCRPTDVFSVAVLNQRTIRRTANNVEIIKNV